MLLLRMDVCPRRASTGAVTVEAIKETRIRYFILNLNAESKEVRMCFEVGSSLVCKLITD
jgi:hypothetical protein